MKIRLHPINKEIEGDSNRSLLQLCHDNKVELKSLCKGVPSCAECRVRILAGDANVIPPNKAELSLIGTSYYIDGRRLACQIRAFGDISVDITEHLKEDDNTNKKIRGFRPPPGQSRESKAVQGTLVLQEPAAEVPARRNAVSARGAGAASDRGRQVRHPGDEFVAGSEHVETLDAADLDGSGDEGVIDPTLVDGDIYAGDDGDTSEAIIHDLAQRESSTREREGDDLDEDDDGDDSDDAETGGSSGKPAGGSPRGGAPRGPQRGPRPPGGSPGGPAKNAGPGGEGGGQKRRRRRGGRGRRGGGGGGNAPSTPKS